MKTIVVQCNQTPKLAKNQKQTHKKLTKFNKLSKIPLQNYLNLSVPYIYSRLKVKITETILLQGDQNSKFAQNSIKLLKSTLA